MKKLFVSLFLVLLVGGTYFVFYQKARSELSLAELKSDLDGMYAPLQTMALLQVPSAKERLSEVSRAIAVREEMLRAVADHDHELAVKSSAMLLSLAPQHTDGIRVMRESGQIFYLLRQALETTSSALKSEKPTQASYDSVSFEDGMESGEDNSELVMYIQKGLSQLGHYDGIIDGDAGPGTKKALEKFQNSQEIGNTLVVDVESANEIAQALALEKAVLEWKERRFYDVNRAHDLASAAVALDPRFERAIRLANDLERAHESIALIQSLNAIESSRTLLLNAWQIHDSVVLILNTAAGSRYTSPSEKYSEAKPILDEYKRFSDTIQSEIDEEMRLVGMYKGERSREYFESVKEFVQVVRTGTGALLVPTGNLLQFRQAGSDTVKEFRRAYSRVESSLPNSAALDEAVSGFVNVFSKYQLFEDPETEQIIDAHVDLYAT